jgi:hypothetical protein
MSPLPVLVKPLAERPARAPLLTLQFVGAVAVTLPTALILGQGALRGPTATVGFFTGLAAHAHWRAIELSLSRTALFALWDDLVARSLLASDPDSKGAQPFRYIRLGWGQGHANPRRPLGRYANSSHHQNRLRESSHPVGALPGTATRAASITRAARSVTCG